MKIMTHQVTVKGQVTIPKQVREYLGIVPGSGVEFEMHASGAVMLRKAGQEKASGKGRTHSKSRFAALRGTRKTGMSTDQIMKLLRGYGEDARDPGFKPGKK